MLSDDIPAFTVIVSDQSVFFNMESVADFFGQGGSDRLFGGPGVDRAAGGPQTDACEAERTFTCEP